MGAGAAAAAALLLSLMVTPSTKPSVAAQITSTRTIMPSMTENTPRLSVTCLSSSLMARTISLSSAFSWWALGSA